MNAARKIVYAKDYNPIREYLKKSNREEKLNLTVFPSIWRKRNGLTKRYED